MLSKQTVSLILLPLTYALNVVSRRSSYPNITSHCLYFSLDFKSSSDVVGVYLDIFQIAPPHSTPTEGASFQEFCVIQRESAASDLETAQAQLQKDGYCVLDVSDLGFHSHDELYREIKRNESKVTKRMNEKQWIKGQLIAFHALSPILNLTAPYLHRDNGWRFGEFFVLWIPGSTNKHLVLIPNSSFESPKTAAMFLRLTDKMAIKQHLEQYARIPDSGAIIIFQSTSSSKPLRSCIHAGIIDKFGKQQTLIHDGNPQSIVVDFKVIAS